MTTAGYLAIAGLYGLVLTLVALVIGSMRQTTTLRVALAQMEGKLGELRGEMEALRSDFHAEFAIIRQEMATTAADLAGELSELRERLAKIEA